MLQVGTRLRQTSRGVVAFRLHRTFSVHAGFSHRYEELVIDGIYENGTFVRARVRSYTINGNAADAGVKQSMERQYESPKPGTTFEPPFDLRYTSAYRYAIDPSRTIAFSSSARDAAHGNGIFAYDARGDVLWYEYQPGALPPYATSATITDRRAEVLPGYWAVTSETQQYKGKYGPFPGAGTVQIDFSHFRRYHSLQQAIDRT